MVLGTIHARMNKTFFYGWSKGPLSVYLLLLKTRKSNQSEGSSMIIPSSDPINKAESRPPIQIGKEQSQ